MDTWNEKLSSAAYTVYKCRFLVAIEIT